MTNRSRKSRQRTAIFHFSLVICHFADAICHCSFAIYAVVRKNVAPASSRHTVLLTQKELSRLTCRRDAGATILSHDLRLCGETLFWLRLPCAVSQVIHGRDARATLAAGAREGPSTPAGVRIVVPLLPGGSLRSPPANFLSPPWGEQPGRLIPPPLCPSAPPPLRPSAPPPLCC